MYSVPGSQYSSSYDIRIGDVVQHLCKTTTSTTNVQYPVVTESVQDVILESDECVFYLYVSRIFHTDQVASVLVLEFVPCPVLDDEDKRESRNCEMSISPYRLRITRPQP